MRQIKSAIIVVVLTAACVFSRPTAVEAATRTTVCSAKAITRAITALTSKHALMAPMVSTRTNDGTGYLSGVSLIVVEGCATSAVLAHEIGHYVTDLAGRYEGGDTLSAAQRFTRFPNWIKSHSDPDGVERAAHCVGNLLGEKSVWTRCPHKRALAAAKVLLEKAQLQSLAYEQQLRDEEIELEALLARQEP